MAKNDPDILISLNEKTENLPDPIANFLHSFVDEYVKGETSIGFYGVMRSLDPLGFSAALCVPMVDDKIQFFINIDDKNVSKVTRNDGNHPDKESTLNSDQDETSRKEISFANLIPLLEQETEGIRIVGKAKMKKPYIAADSSPTVLTITIGVEEMSDSFANNLMLFNYTKKTPYPWPILVRLLIAFFAMLVLGGIIIYIIFL